MPETMNFDSIFNLEDLTRELAESYAKGIGQLQRDFVMKMGSGGYYCEFL